MTDNFRLKVGCTIYSKIDNGIKAEWIFNRNNTIERGTGVGALLTKNNQNNRFDGEYEIIYTDTNGNKSPKLKLIISYKTGHYNLTWINNKEITDVGIGFEKDNMLFAGYSEIK